MEKKIKNVLNYYLLTSKLKDVIRSGWKMWNVKKERLESVAEHVYGTCMLAIAVWSETLPPVNLAEVLMTLAIHETEEVVIGDLTPFDKGYEDKKIKGQAAIKDVFKDLMAKEVFETLITNFDNQSTPEAIFAYKCDKLECDLQAKMYDEAGVMNIENAGTKV
ncbi:MAG: HD domain-containing protein, partial [Clostridia bacterium]|nr:HD domain-containing protein [Clostridia bacterium]